MPVASAPSAGVVVSLYGDHPAKQLDPMKTETTAITRQSMAGTVIVGDQRLSVNQALAAITLNAGKLLRQEMQLGLSKSVKRPNS